jgi:hypothetical protein
LGVYLTVAAVVVDAALIGRAMLLSWFFIRTLVSRQILRISTLLHLRTAAYCGTAPILVVFCIANLRDKIPLEVQENVFALWSSTEVSGLCRRLDDARRVLLRTGIEVYYTHPQGPRVQIAKVLIELREEFKTGKFDFMRYTLSPD